ncbi:MAG: aldehyde ferredoxin oxidoreductase C-terminal domain-containing protein, partial [Dehalococcoidales bacterium]|nr:aldehyde ferredoxin oxidoreductase C-terminal domain-containing protein [Dehalococcoidales bacterium]
QPVPIADIETANRLRREHIAELRTAQFRGHPFWEQRKKYGTGGHADESAHSGDTPVKNWGGVGVVDFPNPSGLSGDMVIANKDRGESCWHCPLGCQAILKEGKGEYNYPAGTRRPEYETLGSFGTMCLNDNAESVAMANHICNAYGLDTISAGATVAFAIECYENGLITREDTGGIELRWGNHRAIIAMTEKLAKREGLGDILADGVKVAAEKIGRGAEEYAVHIGGQELGMHDPKLSRAGTPSAARYQMAPTPGRHTQGFGPSGFRGNVVNAAGLCTFGYNNVDPNKYIVGFLSAVTGWDRSIDELLKCGERIANIRHVFNLREGINPQEWKVNPRILGTSSQTEGPLKGITADLETQVKDNLKALDWDLVTTRPSKKKLLELGLDDVVEVLYP